MEAKVTDILVEALKNEYGEDCVSYVDGNVYVVDKENDGACEVSIRYEE